MLNLDNSTEDQNKKNEIRTLQLIKQFSNLLIQARIHDGMSWVQIDEIWDAVRTTGERKSPLLSTEEIMLGFSIKDP